MDSWVKSKRVECLRSLEEAIAKWADDNSDDIPSVAYSVATDRAMAEAAFAVLEGIVESSMLAEDIGDYKPFEVGK